MRGIGRPRLFISYARSDAALARIVKDALEKEGFEAFVDTEQMLVGESFVRRIVGELRKVDGRSGARSSIAQKSASWTISRSSTRRCGRRATRRAPTRFA